jgi:hypothetical protein
VPVISKNLPVALIEQVLPHGRFALAILISTIILPAKAFFVKDKRGVFPKNFAISVNCRPGKRFHSTTATAISPV